MARRWLLGPDSFLAGELEGEGRVFAPFRRFDQSFTYAAQGVWSEEHQALHFDESFTLGEGRRRRREWVLYLHEDGSLIGHDIRQSAETRGRVTPDGGLRLKLTRRLRRLPEWIRLAVRLQVSPEQDRAVQVRAHASLLLIPMGRVEAEVRRKPARRERPAAG